MRRPPALSGYRMMWLYVMFDLPVGTPGERKAATSFRKFLLDEGFEMAQFSVYLRFCESKEAAETHIGHIREALPKSGKVHLVTITDKYIKLFRTTSFWFVQRWCFLFFFLYWTI